MFLCLFKMYDMVKVGNKTSDLIKLTVSTGDRTKNVFLLFLL